MGRRKTFDEHEILAQATALFWRQGYSATTYQRLEATTGISARSLINCFGDKDQLFLKALDNYRSEVLQMLENLPSAGSETILAFFRELANAPIDSPLNQGCMMVNANIQSEGNRQAIHTVVKQFRSTLTDFFAHCLRADGISNAAERATLIVYMLWGCSMEIRLAGSVKAISPLIDSLTELIQEWRE